MYCRNCGHEVKDGDTFCTNCGALVDSSNNANNTNSTNNTNENKVNYNSNVYVDHGNPSIAALSFFVPVMGLILFLIWKKLKPKTAKQAGKLALIGAVIKLFFIYIPFIFMLLK